MVKSFGEFKLGLFNVGNLLLVQSSFTSISRFFLPIPADDVVVAVTVENKVAKLVVDVVVNENVMDVDEKLVDVELVDVKNDTVVEVPDTVVDVVDSTVTVDTVHSPLMTHRIPLTK